MESQPGYVGLDSTSSQLDIADIYRTFHPESGEYILLSSAHGTFVKIDHILGPETGLSIFKRIQVIQSVFPVTGELN